MRVVPIDVGAEVVHSVLCRLTPVHLVAGDARDQTSGVQCGGGMHSIVLACARALDLGILLVDVRAKVFGHVLSGGATVDKGVRSSGQGADRVAAVASGGQVQGGGGVAGRVRHQFCACLVCVQGVPKEGDGE